MGAKDRREAKNAREEDKKNSAEAAKKKAQEDAYWSAAGEVRREVPAWASSSNEILPFRMGSWPPILRSRCDAGMMLHSVLRRCQCFLLLLAD